MSRLCSPCLLRNGSLGISSAGQGFKLQTVLNSAKCLTASSLANGAAVVIEDCGTNATSLNTWFSTPLAPRLPRCDGWTFRSGSRRTKLQMWACSATDGGRRSSTSSSASEPQPPIAQEFIFSEGSTIEWGGGIVVDGVKVCVDVTDGVTTNGNQLQIWECTGNNSNQKFNMIPV
ncbi:hypothetical protein B0H10DRAFT_1941837 [Mycena sp. CBHHK59/15]|nr:hypothetical protein B0H10DRAFT_1941837 [Mycena sp. CBHHK59/15]